MKKIICGAMACAAVVVCLFLTGCEENGYVVPTKTGGGGKAQPYLPKGNSNGGQYIHLDKN